MSVIKISNILEKITKNNSWTPAMFSEDLCKMYQKLYVARRIIQLCKIIYHLWYHYNKYKTNSMY